MWCGASLAHGTRLWGRTRCGRCGAATTDPWPTDDELREAYGSWYRPNSGRRFALGLGDAILRRTRASFARHLDRVAPPGAILDVGAGEGVLVDGLARRGRVAVGLERDPQRPDMREQSVAEVEGEWAAVVFWHSLEHLPDSGLAVREAARLVGRGGLIVIAVPNTDSLQARAFGDRWLHLDLPRHLTHLSERALVRRLEACGFEVQDVSHVRAGQIAIGWLDGLVGLLPGGLRLYPALRRSDARSGSLSPAKRAITLTAGVALLPVALACAAIEVALGRSGTVYVEARRR